MVAALPQYAIGEQIGEGGMGVVYGGVHRQLGRPVAIKRLPHAVAEDPRMSERFEHEARLLARLDHPHIVPVYDYVRQQGEHLLVMERLDGGTVWSRFSERGPHRAAVLRDRAGGAVGPARGARGGRPAPRREAQEPALHLERCA